MKTPSRLLAAMSGVALLLSPVTATATGRVDLDGARGGAAYWNATRIGTAVSRDFSFDAGAKVGRLQTSAAPAKVSRSTTTSWLDGGLPLTATGRVFFTMGGLNYSCSGAVVTDGVEGRALVLTAAHCVWDPATGFATNWTFIPAYDLDPRGSCAITTGAGSFEYGCWSATSLVAPTGFTAETGFTTAATAHDWAFAVTGAGGNLSLYLDDAVGSFDLAAPGFSEQATAYSFGYPAQGKFKGKDLIYAYGPVASDTSNESLTWGMDNTMTGGASGGPWLSSFNHSSDTGYLSSVNSYKYSTVSGRMYGPKFNSETLATFAAAKTANANQSAP